MSLMANLYVGKSGLQTSQNALNTTAHNLSNVDTAGYTRQQVLQSDYLYTSISRSSSAISYKQIGEGVAYAAVRQVRDVFLDQTYRREAGRSSYYAASYRAMNEVEGVLGELYNGATFSNSLEEFEEAIGELAKTPTDSVVLGLVMQRASSFIEGAQAVYQGLCDYQDNLNLQVQTNINKINRYAKQIQGLNEQIIRIESGGQEHANDLRDVRNQLLDELGGMAKITYKEDTYGNVTVQLEGHDLVARDFVYEIGMEEDDITGFVTPFWIVDAKYTVNADGKREYDTEGAEVFNLKQRISSDANTDVGGTKALLLARGDKRANYTDLEDETTYNKEIAPSIIMNIQAEFDQLVHEVTTRINGILSDAADPSTGYLCERIVVNGVETYRPIQLFQKKVTDGYTYGQGENGKDDWLYNAEDPDASESLYTTMNLIVNPDLLREPTKLNFMMINNREDYKTAAELAAAFQVEILRLNPNVTMRSNFQDYYSDLVEQVANTGWVLNDINLSQQDTLEATCYAREQIVGVSSDEELTNMVKFQNAYNASSRYINVVNEMLEHLLNSLAG